MGVECRNCGSEVSNRFYSVMWPEDAPVLNCPDCPEENLSSFEPKIETEGH